MKELVKRLRYIAKYNPSTFNAETENQAASAIEKLQAELEQTKRERDAAMEKQVPKKPMYEGLAERLCPVCRAYIPFDALNDDASEAPNYCDCCGQAFDWGDLCG